MVSFGSPGYGAPQPQSMKTRLPIALTACVLLTSGCALLRDILPGDRDAELQRQRQQRDELARRAADQERELARLHLLLLETSCFRYWGQGTWTDYAREIHRRGMGCLA